VLSSLLRRAPLFWIKRSSTAAPGDYYENNAMNFAGYDSFPAFGRPHASAVSTPLVNPLSVNFAWSLLQGRAPHTALHEADAVNPFTVPASLSRSVASSC